MAPSAMVLDPMSTVPPLLHNKCCFLLLPRRFARASKIPAMAAGIHGHSRGLREGRMDLKRKVCTAEMNLSGEVDIEEYVSRPNKISAVQDFCF